MVVDRLPDGFALAVAPRVEAADDALQVGELADHVGHEVGPREPRRAGRLGHRVAEAEVDREPLGERLDPLRLPERVAELLLEGEAGEPRDPLLEREPAVVVPEEAGVGEAGVEDPLVAADDVALRVARVVGHGEEVSGERPRGLARREDLLVLAHRRDEDLFRELEVRRVERAADQPRPLDEVCEGVEEDRVVDRGAPRPRRRAPPAFSPRVRRRTA